MFSKIGIVSAWNGTKETREERKARQLWRQGLNWQRYLKIKGQTGKLSNEKDAKRVSIELKGIVQNYISGIIADTDLIGLIRPALERATRFLQSDERQAIKERQAKTMLLFLAMLNGDNSSLPIWQRYCQKKLDSIRQGKGKGKRAVQPDNGTERFELFNSIEIKKGRNKGKRRLLKMRIVKGSNSHIQRFDSNLHDAHDALQTAVLDYQIKVWGEYQRESDSNGISPLQRVGSCVIPDCIPFGYGFLVLGAVCVARDSQRWFAKIGSGTDYRLKRGVPLVQEKPSLEEEQICDERTKLNKLIREANNVPLGLNKRHKLGFRIIRLLLQGRSPKKIGTILSISSNIIEKVYRETRELFFPELPKLAKLSYLYRSQKRANRAKS